LKWTKREAETLFKVKR